MDMDVNIFPDIADKLGLPSPAFIEKDYFAVQLLKLATQVKLDDFRICFAGGTCLSKAHSKNLCRMSEDLDLKFMIGSSSEGQSKKKRDRKLLDTEIQKLINDSNVFTLGDKISSNQGASRCYEIEYLKKYTHASLRPELKLEFIEMKQYLLAPLSCSVGSIYARETGQDDEIKNIHCDAIEVILVEKLIALLRRTALTVRNHSTDDDETLIRHIYDLYFICEECHYDKNQVESIIIEVIDNDRNKFGNKHPEFNKDPYSELNFGLQNLAEDKLYRNRYENFLAPLVYHDNPPTWEQGLDNVKNLLLKHVK